MAIGIVGYLDRAPRNEREKNRSTSSICSSTEELRAEVGVPRESGPVSTRKDPRVCMNT